MKRDIAVFMFDVSGVMAQPWLAAGYECWILDIQHVYRGIYNKPWPYSGVTSEGRLHKVLHDLSRPWLPPFERSRVAFAFAFPPCDHVAVSGARWFSGKGLRRLAWEVEMFATAAEQLEWFGAPYGIENPKSNMASHWRKSDHMFSPWEFTSIVPEDCYTKETHVWAGHGFRMPEPAPLQEVADAVSEVMRLYKRKNKYQLPAKRDVLERFATDPAGFERLRRWYPDNRIHDAPPSDDRADLRSETPLGFARATFMANAPHLRTPHLALEAA